MELGYGNRWRPPGEEKLHTVLAASEPRSTDASPQTAAAMRPGRLHHGAASDPARPRSALRLGHAAVTTHALEGTELPDLWSS